MKSRKADTPARAPGKKPYAKPRLTVHGNVQRLTRGGGGNKQDGGGKPNTRLSGPPA